MKNIVNNIIKDKADKVTKDKSKKEEYMKNMVNNNIIKDKADKVTKDKAEIEAKKRDTDAKRTADTKDKYKKNKIYEDKAIMNETKKILEDYEMINYNDTSDQTFLNNKILEILNNMIKLLKDKLLNGYGDLGINNYRYEVQIESKKNVEKMLKLLESIKNGGMYSDYIKIKNLEQVIGNVVPKLRWYSNVRIQNINNSVVFYRWHMEIKSILKRLNDLKNNDSNEGTIVDKNNYYKKYLKYKSKYLKLKK